MTQPLLQAADLRGGARLTTDAVAGLASLVEAMRVRLASLSPPTPADASHRREGRAAGPAGPGQGTVRGDEPLAAGGAEAMLGWLAPALATADPRQPSHPEHEAVVAALNGLLGDHLAATDNPLAITMAFRHAGARLPLERLALRARLQQPTPRLLVLLHGLCLNDLQWRRAGHDHAEALARELGFTPIHLHYNTGLSISTNGRILAPLMENLYDAWPMPIQRLAMMGHGMGGLVARSAIHHGQLIQRGRLRWPARVGDLVCLGSPHLGAPFDQPGHGIDLLLGATPYAGPLARLGKLRSAGIDDLRRGNIVPGPAGDDGTQPCTPVGLPGDTRCFTVAASLGEAGDGLVPVASALGQHQEPGRRLDFAPNRQAVVHDTSHLDLLSSPQVYSLLRQWLG